MQGLEVTVEFVDATKAHTGLRAGQETSPIEYP